MALGQMNEPYPKQASQNCLIPHRLIDTPKGYDPEYDQFLCQLPKADRIQSSLNVSCWSIMGYNFVIELSTGVDEV